ncbi:hypothetical protein VTL71DRAFT_14267 [Oculimacula yallundae]|uniref:Berberine/berberine-like domain-containing protein n=1 Tax=Oculimacula yallundae TaxID=86028 RepID=A0ABR4CHY7_9HELO
MVIVMTWTEEELDDICREHAQRWASQLQETFQKAKSAIVDTGEIDSVTQDGVAHYMNYNGFDSHGDKMFGINYPRLKELEICYDPKNLFNKCPKLI